MTTNLFTCKWLLVSLLVLPYVALAQKAPADTTAPAEAINFDEFADADSTPVTSFCTQKVLFLSPARLISIGYETQSPFNLLAIGPHGNLPTVAPEQRVTGFGGLRLALNTPIISRSNFILNVGLTYWNTNGNLPAAATESSPFFRLLGQGLRSTGVNLTAFKPINDRRFVIVQASADLNGNYRTFDELTGKAITYSATAIYGWKKNDNFMWGLGVTRTYRAGQVIHIPVVLYNRTFSPAWGVEAIFPAKVNLRRNFGTNSLLMIGYEIEGNSYYLADNLYLRRGELKPRITYEQKLSGFIWLSAQVGYRHNWRFDAFNTQNPVADQRPVFNNTIGGTPYFNLSLNLVSP